MKIFALIVTGSASAETKPATPNPNAVFTKKFYAQIDTANKALETFINMPCTIDEKTFQTNLEALQTELHKVATLTQQIPDSQSEIVQVKEVEATYGLMLITKEFAQKRVDACNPTTPEPTVPPVNITKKQ